MSSTPLKDSLVRMEIASNEKIADGMVDALAQSLGKSSVLLRNSIIPGDEFYNSNNALTVMGESGLRSLAAAVERDLEALNQNGCDTDAEMYRVQISVPRHNLNFELEMKSGENLMQLAARNSDFAEYCECSCGGNMSCATCHVYIDSKSYSKLLIAEGATFNSENDLEVEEAEQDMLDLAYEPKDGSSRLGCQVTMSKDVDGMVITIPDGVNNMWK